MLYKSISNEMVTFRLDFLSFSIAQPNAETVCTTDTFQIGGTSNKVPVICGDNAGQHSNKLSYLSCFLLRNLSLFQCI